MNSTTARTAAYDTSHCIGSHGTQYGGPTCATVPSRPTGQILTTSPTIAANNRATILTHITSHPDATISTTWISTRIIRSYALATCPPPNFSDVLSNTSIYTNAT